MSAPPTIYHVHARVEAGGRAILKVADQRIPLDARWGASEVSGLPGPADLLAGAFAACLMKNVERSGVLLPFRYERAEVDVRAARRDAPPGFVEIEYEVRMVTDEPERRIDLLHRKLR